MVSVKLLVQYVSHRSVIITVAEHVEARLQTSSQNPIQSVEPK